jgi:diguanylate cyclase (GGDEF)-like protein
MFSPTTHRLRGNIALLIVVLAALTGGSWAITKVTIEHLLYRDAVATGHTWASYLAQSVGDLSEIAKGKKPSAASMAFFEQVQKVGNVFRYKIFDPEGYLRLVSDELTAGGTDVQNLGEHNAAAARAIAAGQPLVVAMEGNPPARPSYFSEAYVPLIVDGRTIAIVEAYVDQTEKRDHFSTALTLAAVSLSLLMALAFCIPAVAFYWRTKEKQRADERIHFLAHHDAMTGLSNRNQLIENLQKGFIAVVPHGKMLALHYVDIDHFKDINDTFGHDVGDSLLMITAERLRTIAGPNDFVARLGGDEFALLQLGIEEKGEAEQTAHCIVEVLAKPFMLNGQQISATASVGVALAPADGDEPKQLLKNADIAMYKSKADGRKCMRFFAPGMVVELQARLELERTLRAAALVDGFELHFQPVVDIPDGRLVGFEALLRLRSPDGSFIPPAVFIPVAEEIGLINHMGAWVIREACRSAATWPDNLTVAVNLSAAQFGTNSICDIVAAAVVETGLELHRLELEITESLLLGDTEAVLAELGMLKALGIAIVMDDFGTGYSSLNYLWRFPFDKVKIDRSFMIGFDTSDKNVEKIVKTIVGLGRSLHMQVTVEGVENAHQAEFVRKVNCDQAQGFYFGRPMPSAEVAAFILADFKGRLPIERVALETNNKLRLVN